MLQKNLLVILLGITFNIHSYFYFLFIGPQSELDDLLEYSWDFTYKTQSTNNNSFVYNFFDKQRSISFDICKKKLFVNQIIKLPITDCKQEPIIEFCFIDLKNPKGADNSLVNITDNYLYIFKFNNDKRQWYLLSQILMTKDILIQLKQSQHIQSSKI